MILHLIQWDILYQFKNISEYKMGLKHLIMLDSKEILKDDWGPVKKDFEDNLKMLPLTKDGQFEH